MTRGRPAQIPAPSHPLTDAPRFSPRDDVADPLPVRRSSQYSLSRRRRFLRRATPSASCSRKSPRRPRTEWDARVGGVATTNPDAYVVDLPAAVRRVANRGTMLDAVRAAELAVNPASAAPVSAAVPAGTAHAAETYVVRAPKQILAVAGTDQRSSARRWTPRRCGSRSWPSRCAPTEEAARTRWPSSTTRTAWRAWCRARCPAPQAAVRDPGVCQPRRLPVQGVRRGGRRHHDAQEEPPGPARRQGLAPPQSRCREGGGARRRARVFGSSVFGPGGVPRPARREAPRPGHRRRRREGRHRGRGRRRG